VSANRSALSHVRDACGPEAMTPAIMLADPRPLPVVVRQRRARTLSRILPGLGVSSDGTLLEKFDFRLRPRAGLNAEHPEGTGIRNVESRDGEVENRGNGERETGGKETRGRASHDADTVAAMTCTLWGAYYYDYPRLSGRLLEDLEHTTGSSPTASKLRPEALRLRSSSD